MHSINTKLPRNSYFISTNLVDDAPEFTKKGLQQVHPISTTNESTFTFLVASPCKAHLAAVQISILIIATAGSSNPSYKPDTIVCPCCDRCDLVSIQKATQQVYDVYIRPIQWSLEFVIRRPTDLASCSPCQERAQHVLKGLQTGTEYEIAYARTPTSNNARNINTCAQDIQGHGKRKGLNASTSDEDDFGSTEREEIDNSALKPKKRKRATPQKLDKQEQDDQDKKIAEGLSEKILDQLDRICQREISTYPQEIEAIVDRYQRAEENEQISILMALRERMWEGGEGCEDNEALAPGVLRWTRKFGSSCILYMLRKKRAIQATDTQRNWADATSIIHSVVKGLLDEEGTKVLGLFKGLASTE